MGGGGGREMGGDIWQTNSINKGWICGEVGKWEGIFDKPITSINLINDKNVEFLSSIFNDWRHLG